MSLQVSQSYSSSSVGFRILVDGGSSRWVEILMRVSHFEHYLRDVIVQADEAESNLFGQWSWGYRRHLPAYDLKSYRKTCEVGFGTPVGFVWVRPGVGPSLRFEFTQLDYVGDMPSIPPRKVTRWLLRQIVSPKFIKGLEDDRVPHEGLEVWYTVEFEVINPDGEVVLA